MDDTNETARERALANALLELEDANSTVCALRTDELYDAMIRVPGMSDALIRLDDARRLARSLLS